jgi:hypothetical protein
MARAALPVIEDGGVSVRLILGDAYGEVVLHVVTVPDLGRPTVAAPVMGDDAIALPKEG